MIIHHSCAIEKYLPHVCLVKNGPSTARPRRLCLAQTSRQKIQFGTLICLLGQSLFDHDVGAKANANGRPHLISLECWTCICEDKGCNFLFMMLQDRCFTATNHRNRLTNNQAMNHRDNFESLITLPDDGPDCAWPLTLRSLNVTLVPFIAHCKAVVAAVHRDAVMVAAQAS